MIDNRWSDADAQAWVDALGPDASEADKVLAHRVYTSQIIGQNPDLVMHGGATRL